MKNILYILFLFALIACKSSTDDTQTDNKPNEIVKEEKFPTILDTLNIDLLDFLKNDTINSTWLSTAEYDFLYIGAPKDSIYVDHFLSFSPPPPPPPNSEGKKYNLPKYENKFGKHYIEWDAPIAFKSVKNAKIEIRINTMKTINNSYPVIVTNQDIDTVMIGYGNHMPIIMEALDSNNVWKPIEKRYIYGCGNGVGTIILPPKDIVLTSAPIFNGDYTTKLRLRFYKTDIYSNTFNGSINYRQFESKFTPQGDYKEEYKLELKNKTTR